jgi:hypothetical protein
MNQDLKRKADKALRTSQYAEENNEKQLKELMLKRLSDIDNQLPEGKTAGDLVQ